MKTRYSTYMYKKIILISLQRQIFVLTPLANHYLVHIMLTCTKKKKSCRRTSLGVFFFFFSQFRVSQSKGLQVTGPRWCLTYTNQGKTNPYKLIEQQLNETNLEAIGNMHQIWFMMIMSIFISFCTFPTIFTYLLISVIYKKISSMIYTEICIIY